MQTLDDICTKMQQQMDRGNRLVMLTHKEAQLIIGGRKRIKKLTATLDAMRLDTMRTHDK